MPFWRGETLNERLPSLVDPFDAGAIDCAAYTLRVGGEIYVSPDRQVGDPSRHTKQRLELGKDLLSRRASSPFSCRRKR